ncbi:Carboxylesterase A [Diplogelasinospora grovesii]|uniref:Carboxylesterase A n=1 Tax=Diplogelasinospora grovesii TaxID=303347 RepID=A0AAN6ND77_9PEZI|nr:Carboxylesterase A [Diplogelasinospora grovesii]
MDCKAAELPSIEAGKLETAPLKAPRPRPSAVKAVLAALFIGLLWWSVYIKKVHLRVAFGYIGEHHHGHEEEPGYDANNPWKSITPSEELEWHPCYPGLSLNPQFQCARLTVPMDYSGQRCQLGGGDRYPKDEVHIALLLLPAQNDTGKSPMLINPGGPGGSGVGLAMFLAPSLQTIFGADQPVIGFDPRGIGLTTPRADCWAVPEPGGCEGCPDDIAKGFFHRQEWTNVNSAYGTIARDYALKHVDIGHKAVNDMCRDKTERDGRAGRRNILAHANTEHVARDMLSIVDAWDAHVNTQQPASNVMENTEKGKLVYWGFSYGTYLGATFARMFPGRVGRLLLDGVVDAELYETPMWRESLLDTDKVLHKFFEYCFEADSQCHLRRAGDKSPKDVEDRVLKILRDLEEHPVTFTNPQSFSPVILPAQLVRKLVFGALYSPIQNFPLLAMFLHHISERDTAMLWGMFPDMMQFCVLEGWLEAMFPGDAQRAVMCGDKDHPMNLTLGESKKELELMGNFSMFADIWVELMLQCNGWDIYSPHPAPQKRGWEGKEQIETSFPILFLSNTYDPVTPLKAAVKMAGKFKDAGLVEQKAEGHCTVSAVSRCTARRIRDYVVDGKVPPAPTVGGENGEGKWTTCEADERPWKSFKGVEHRASGGYSLSEELEEEVQILEAFQHVQNLLEAFTMWQRPDRREGWTLMRWAWASHVLPAKGE